MCGDSGGPRFELHPLHGIHEPTTTTPRRRPRSVRRTSAIDISRDAGSFDPVYLRGHARDLWTAADGSAAELARARLSTTVELASRTVRRIETEPRVDNLSALVGAPAVSGFRAAVDTAVPQLRRRRDPLYTLMDDVPITALISGLSLTASGMLGDAAKSGYLPMADRCAGFVSGGLLMTSFEAGDPAIPTGPVAPALEDPDDPQAWHEMAPLPTHGMRRRRRLDVYQEPGIPHGTIAIDAMFRDTYVRADDTETVIHEYTVAATVDPATGVIVRARATPRVLPWQECPGAVESATRIAGMTLSDLHFRVRAELAGITTCTHLNDLLRSVADAAALIPRLTAG
jgi:hypothetical protein